MATVRDVRLFIEQFPLDKKRWSLHATYTLDFEEWERAAWFRETVDIIGLRDGEEVLIARLTGSPLQPNREANDGIGATVSRTTPVVEVGSKQLDVQPDGELILVTPPLAFRLPLHFRDDISARVVLLPLVASAASASSPKVPGQFGADELVSS